LIRPQPAPAALEPLRKKRHGLAAFRASVQRFAAARSAVEESEERGPWMKVQAGGVMRANRPASASSMRAYSNVLAITDDRNASVEPGRSITAIGIARAMWRQRSQRWKSRRLSAPITQTKATPGLRLCTRSIVSAE